MRHLLIISEYTPPYRYTCQAWSGGYWASWCCRIVWNIPHRRGRRRPSCVVGQSSSYGACSHETKQIANSPRQKPFAGAAESSYKALGRVRKSRGACVPINSSESLFRVGSESRWWRLCRFGRCQRPSAAPIACRVALLSATRRMPPIVYRASPYFRISP